MAVLTDVPTPQVLARKELERVNRELEEFAYVASHDLQEPLRMINIYTQLLVQRYADNEPQARRYAGFITQGAERMELLLRDLLSYSRVIHPDEGPVPSASLSRRCRTAVAGISKSNARKYSVPDGPKIKISAKEDGNAICSLLLTVARTHVGAVYQSPNRL